MPRGEELRARLMTVFAAEAEDHLNVLAGCLAALERGLPEDQVGASVESAFRALHTLKGAARSVDLREIEAVCQTLEEAFGAVKTGRVVLTQELLARVQQGLDDVSRLLRSAVSEPLPDRTISAKKS